MLRAFKITMYVAIDEDESSDLEDRDEGDETERKPATLDEVKEYFREALLLDIDIEGCDNPLGFQSAEVVYETMAEMPREEVEKLYH